MAIAVVACGTCTSVRAGLNSSLMDISADGRLLVCSNRDSGTVTVVDLTTHTKLHEIGVGPLPEGVSFLGSSHCAAVAVYANDCVVFLDADRGAVLGQTNVFDEPYGVASDPAGTRLFVSLDYPGRVVEIDASSRQVVREIPAGEFTRGIALSPEGDRLYVTEYHTGNLLAIDLSAGRLVDQWPGSSNDNLARQVVVHPTRPKAYLAHIRSRVSAVHGEGSIFPYVSVVDTRDSADANDDRRRHIPMDSFRGALVTANPWDCAISPDARHFFVVFAGTDDMFACDVVDDDYKEIEYRQYLRVGKNPRAVRVAPDNQRFYVYSALDFRVVAYNIETLKAEHEVQVTTYPHDDHMLRGKVLFYSALQPMASRRWISCASCHPDGQPDGRTWANPEGLRNTQSLAGMAWTHPIHWSADRDEVQDFEHTIRGKLMQGRGLLEGELHAELGEPNCGRSTDLDALAAYSNSHSIPLSPHAATGLSESARRGRELFFDARTKCSVCHNGPLYTDSQLGGSLVRHDVGTGEGPDEKLSPEYDTPTLLGVYRTAPYLHHGKAETLEEVLTTFNVGDRHGRTSDLQPEEIADLVEFLKALPYEDAESAAIAAGIRKVER
jgi:YVTN family beta-propeller protein